MLRVVGFKLKENEITDLQSRVERFTNKGQICTFQNVQRLADIRYDHTAITLLVARVTATDEWVKWIPLWTDVMNQNRLRIVWIHSVSLQPLLQITPRQAVRESHQEPITDKALGFHSERQMDACIRDASWILSSSRDISFFSETPQLSSLVARTQNRPLPDGQTWEEVLTEVNAKVRALREDLNRSRRNLKAKPIAEKVSKILQLTEKLESSEREALIQELASTHPELKDLLSPTGDGSSNSG